MTGDLHCHTVFSDGASEIDDVMRMAKKSGIAYLSITDHDTMTCPDKLKGLSDYHGISIVPGVELSAFDYGRKKKVHLLCYLPKRTDLLQEHCNKVLKARMAAGEEMIQKAMKIFPVSREDIMRHVGKSKSIYKQHIMHTLMEAGYSTSIYGDVFDMLYRYPGGKGYVNIDYPDVHDTARLVRKSGGVCVLAHPRVYDSFDLLLQLADSGEIDGVEVWHPRNHEGDSESLTRTADDYGLLKTGGSDFHGMYNSKPAHIGIATMPEEEIDRLYEISSRK